MSEIFLPNQQQNMIQNLYGVTTFLPSSWNPAGVIASFPLFSDLKMAQLFATQNNAQVIAIQVPAEIIKQLEDKFNSSKPQEDEQENIESETTQQEEVENEVSDSARSGE